VIHSEAKQSEARHISRVKIVRDARSWAFKNGGMVYVGFASVAGGCVGEENAISRGACHRSKPDYY
jgi:hypothetical protein